MLGVVHGFTQYMKEAPRSLLAHVSIKHVLQRAASTEGQGGNRSKPGHNGTDITNTSKDSTEVLKCFL